MGSRAFCFYVDAAISYLMSPTSKRDSDALNSFVGSVMNCVETGREGIAEVIPRLRVAFEYLSDSLHRYDLDSDIYEDVPGRLAELLALSSGSGLTVILVRGERWRATVPNIQRGKNRVTRFRCRLWVSMIFIASPKPADHRSI